MNLCGRISVRCGLYVAENVEPEEGGHPDVGHAQHGRDEKEI